MTKIEKQRVTLFLSSSLLKKAKIQSIIEEKSLTALIEESLLRYLPKKNNSKKKFHLIYFLSIKNELERITVFN